MHLLVIGGTGFVGARVVRRLARAGHDVVVFHRGGTEADLPDRVGHFYGDRADLAAYREEFEHFAPDVVLDVIPYTERQAETLARVFEGIAGRLVALSSGDVYRNYDGWRGMSDHAPDPTPLGEEAPLREKLYPYRNYEHLEFEHKDDYDKILVERVLKDAELPVALLRLPTVYGSGDRQHRFFPYLKRMDDGRPFILIDAGQAAWRWTHGYVENVAAAIALAATDERAAGRIYNVGEKKAPAEAQRVRRLGEAAEWTGEIVTLPEDRLPEHLKTKAHWQYELATDTGRIRKELDYVEPVSENEALRRTVAWERAHPPDVDPARFDYAAEETALREGRRSVRTASGREWA